MGDEDEVLERGEHSDLFTAASRAIQIQSQRVISVRRTNIRKKW
jgi:hypothetical protein